MTVRRLSGDADELRLVCSPAPPYTVTDRSGFYNGGQYHWGTFTSPVYETVTRFYTLLPSWQVTTPDETWTQLKVRACSAGTWTPWLSMGVWTSATSAVERHSVNGQKAGGWQVLTDILKQRTGPRLRLPVPFYALYREVGRLPACAGRLFRYLLGLSPARGKLWQVAAP